MKTSNIFLLSIVISIAFFIHVVMDEFASPFCPILISWCIGIILFLSIFLRGLFTLCSEIKSNFKYKIVLMKKE